MFHKTIVPPPKRRKIKNEIKNEIQIKPEPVENIAVQIKQEPESGL